MLNGNPELLSNISRDFRGMFECVCFFKAAVNLFLHYRCEQRLELCHVLC